MRGSVSEPTWCDAMELIYRFDPEKFYLGTPCKAGHLWPGTDRSLRYFPSGPGMPNPCAACRGRKKTPWLHSFLDEAAMRVPVNSTLGKLCKGGHDWNGTGLTLRATSNGKCRKCEAARKTAKRRANPEKARERERLRIQSWSDERRQQALARKMERRRLVGRPSRSKHGLPHRYQEDVLGRRASKWQAQALGRMAAEGWEPEAVRSFLDGWAARQTAICRSGRVTVASLVRDEWDRGTRASSYRQRQRVVSLARYHERMKTDEAFRMAVRHRSKTRKARLRRAHVGDTSGRKIRERFALFGDACAYCGCPGSAERLQIEHIIPISRGGPHAMANIVPACKRCNDSKYVSEVESWYRSQPFFSQQRWGMIQQCMGKGRGPRASAGQLPLL